MCPYSRTIYSLLDIYPVMRFLGQMEFLFLGPWGIATLSSTMTELIYTPTSSVEVFLFLHILMQWCCCLTTSIVSAKRVVFIWVHVKFLHFPNNIEAWHRRWKILIGNACVGVYWIMEEFQLHCHEENECECILQGEPWPKRKKAVVYHDARLQNIVNDCESLPAFMDCLCAIAHNLSL